MDIKPSGITVTRPNQTKKDGNRPVVIQAGIKAALEKQAADKAIEAEIRKRSKELLARRLASGGK